MVAYDNVEFSNALATPRVVWPRFSMANENGSEPEQEPEEEPEDEPEEELECVGHRLVAKVQRGDGVLYLHRRSYKDLATGAIFQTAENWTREQASMLARTAQAQIRAGAAPLASIRQWVDIVQYSTVMVDVFGWSIDYAEIRFDVIFNRLSVLSPRSVQHNGRLIRVCLPVLAEWPAY